MGDYSYEVTYEEHYCHSTNTWDCSYCRKEFRTSLALTQHLESGVHEENRYQCRDCSKKFKSLSAQKMHLDSTGHSPMQERLTHTMISDASKSTMLLLGDRSYDEDYYEATLRFDGAAKPNPGQGGAGWYLFDDRGIEIEYSGIVS